MEVLTGFPNYPGGKLYDGYRVKLWQRECMDGIRVNRVALYPSHDRSGLRRMMNYLSFGASASVIGPWLVRKADVVYVYNLITLGMAARILRRVKGAKVVLNVQDLWPESVVSSGMMRYRSLLAVLNRWCQFEYRRADQLVVLSPGFKQRLVARGVKEHHIDVVYNWCDETSLCVPSPSVTDARQLCFTGRFNIVFAGTMGVVQSLDAVIEAARRIRDVAPDVLFTFVGAGVDVARLKELSRDVDNVQFLPRQDRTEIGRIYANADALLVHLKADPLFEVTVPSKIQAYLFAGKPILCGVLGDAADLVLRSGAGKVFLPENPDSLVSAILQLRALNGDERRRMGELGRRFYDEQLSFEKGTARLEEVFRKVVSGGRKGRE